MVDSTPGRKPANRLIWLLAAALVIAVAFIWFAKPAGESTQAPPAKPVAQSTDWTAEPQGPAVPVKLPDTPMTNTPDGEGAQQAKKE